MTKSEEHSKELLGAKTPGKLGVLHATKPYVGSLGQVSYCTDGLLFTTSKETSATMTTYNNEMQSQSSKKRKRVDKSDHKQEYYSKPQKSTKKTNASASEDAKLEPTFSEPKPPDQSEDNSVLPPTSLVTEKSTRFIVFVGNIPYGCTTDAIEKHFLKVKPAKVRHITDKEKGTSKGYAFLEFEGYDRMKTCLNSYHGTKVKGRKIRVELT